MNKIIKRSFLLLASGLILISSCKKKEECNEAGTGGSVVVKANIKHHSTPINGATVYVKYNTQEFPGNNTAAYDATFNGDLNSNIVVLSGLKCGDYYIYAEGYDQIIDTTVVGGVPFSTDQKEGEISILVPVTEGD
ncbi:MAG TPA: hypothetical protein PKH65_07630 [Bacteroidia bacterium]|nr:hypothetical protein [Bacteroidia bacterium]HNT80535.1 hypothetical protein [Bacteroidia bacterium]